MSEVVTGGINFGNMVTMPIGEHMVVTEQAYNKALLRYLTKLWKPVKTINGYIADDELKQCVKNILVTYETPTGERKVRSIFCDHGRCGKIVNGKVIAWMPLPEAYREGEA